MFQRREVTKKVEEMLSANPSIFPAIKSSYLNAQSLRYGISFNPEWISIVKDPSYELCEYAVSLKPSVIFMIPKKFIPHLRVFACEKDISLIERFDTSIWTEKDIVYLISKNIEAEKYFKK